MLALRSIRSSLRRTLALRALAHQVRSSSTTGHRQQEGTFYEFCTYYLKPSNVEEFLYNFKKNVHLRTAHSELVGYWSVGFGGRINTVFHIWKYDNYAHRAAVYKALAKDKEWQERFLIPNLPFIDKQESEITYLVPWCKIGTPPKEGVYELATFLMRPGGPALWGDAFERAVSAHANQGYVKLIGVFHAEFGLLNRGCMFCGGLKMRTFGQPGDTGHMKTPKSCLLVSCCRRQELFLEPVLIHLITLCVL
ncbi:Nipsnap homolog 3A [Apodemus speciosus]|uniref:Nipsnap homolog 3A n=1 Tax=Apodemus speciosus TaxID=105296 RepID=A0ABQ0EN66_APOSI